MIMGMDEDSPTPRLFLGSSLEGKEIAANLQVELEGSCEAVRWDQDLFEPSGYALESLTATAQSFDFAVFVATPDDLTDSRGETKMSARDNVILEFGLFVGAIGRERTYFMATGDIKLPTDVIGLTRLPYNPQPSGNQRAAVTAAALQIQQRIKELGVRSRQTQVEGVENPDSPLARELDLLCRNAVSQGWVVKKNDDTTLRLKSPRGKTLALTKKTSENTRIRLRRFSKKLRAEGLRVNSSLRSPVEESPF